MPKAKALLLFLILAGFDGWEEARGQSTTPLGDSLKPAVATPADSFIPNLLPNLDIKPASSPIKIDGELNEPAWRGAAVADNFSETYPEEKRKPPIGIKTLVTYDQQNLYLAYTIEDDPSRVRATLCGRDAMWSDDYVGILLDTYGDATWAYYLFANPLGIQGDTRFSTSFGEDESFDAIYDSKGKITPTGFQVEFAIPFSSLRFPSRDEQSWKATFWVNHPRASRSRYSWSAIDRDNPCILCQYGTLSGIKNVRPGKQFELLPSLVVSQSGEQGATKFENEKIEEDASLGLKYGITPSLTAEVTYNPDFSQVESDAAQIDVNSTFALFYPERRPFFQEGTDLFNTYVNAVYTRSVNDPLVATKLTGRFGRTSIAYLGARDERTPMIIPFQEGSDVLATDLKSTSNLVRFKQTFMEDSHIGTLFTGRSLDGGGDNSVIGVDGTIRMERFFRNYRLEWQALYSRTREPNDTLLYDGGGGGSFNSGRQTAAFDGEEFWGQAYYASLERDASLWNFDVDYWQTSPTFRADNGFVSRSDRREVDVWSGLFFRPRSSFVEQIIPSVALGRIWNFQGTRKDEWVVPSLEVNLKGQTFFEVEYLLSQERFRDVQFNGIRYWTVGVESNFSDPVHGGVWVSWGNRIARSVNPPVLGKQSEVFFWAALKPWQNFLIRPEISYARMLHPIDNSRIFSGWIVRNQFNYQFIRELALRLIVQYDDFDSQLSLEPLLSYRLNALTVFYLGSSHGYTETGPDNHFTQTSRQFFLKMQYLFRM